MEERVFIVIVKFGDKGVWLPQAEGVFTSRRLAENLVECKRAAGCSGEFAIVAGPLTNPAQMDAAEASLEQS
jgi:hypothetical protein